MSAIVVDDEPDRKDAGPDSGSTTPSEIESWSQSVQDVLTHPERWRLRDERPTGGGGSGNERNEALSDNLANSPIPQTKGENEVLSDSLAKC